MGVINITPDSFSDGNQNFNQKILRKRLLTFSKENKYFWDIGMESTAPMNFKIKKDQERSRFIFFINSLKKFKIPSPKVISIDSYKIENYEFFISEILKLYPEVKIVINDVSGVVDDSLIKFLEKHVNLFYIYNFTNIKNRAEVLSHMNYVDPACDAVAVMLSSFRSIFKRFKELGMADRLIFDPGLGFSKNYDQNWAIINSFKNWEKKLKKIDPNYVLLIGMSKKSFLQMSLLGTDNKKEDSELIHYMLINELKALSNSKILFRVHEYFT